MGLGHKTAHTAELLNLLSGAACSGIQHHIYGIEALLVGRNLSGNYSGELIVDAGPKVDDLVVALVVGNKAHREVVLDFSHLLVAFFDKGVLLFGIMTSPRLKEMPARKAGRNRDSLYHQGIELCVVHRYFL